MIKSIIFVTISSILLWFGLTSLTKLAVDFNQGQNYIVVDFNQPSTVKRFKIYDSQGILIFQTFVAHGRGSGSGKYLDSVSNKPGSNQSSVGTYRIGESYRGRHGISYRLDGLSSTNSNARRRAIVIHSADYIGYGKTGHSEGCFAIPTRDYKTVLKLIKPGMYLYAIYK